MLLYKNGRFYSKDVSFMVPDGVIAGNHNPPEAPPDQREGIPPAGNQIRRRHLVRPTGRRERAQPAT